MPKSGLCAYSIEDGCASERALEAETSGAGSSATTHGHELLHDLYSGFQMGHRSKGHAA
jgi:hypothetical protein